MKENPNADVQKRGNYKFLFVGRLVKPKNIPLLIHAFNKVLHSFPHSTLTIIGDGPERQTAEQIIASLDIQKNVTFLGWVDSNDLKDIYSGFDALLFTSAWEGFGNTIVEALACGLVVFSTDCNFGPREILLGEDEFYLFEGGYILGKQFALIQYDVGSDIQNLAECFNAAIVAFYDEGTNKLDTNLEYRLKNYTAEAMARRYELLLR